MLLLEAVAAFGFRSACDRGRCRVSHTVHFHESLSPAAECIRGTIQVTSGDMKASGDYMIAYGDDMKASGVDTKASGCVKVMLGC